MHYAVPALLHRAGMLERLYTDLCADAGWLRHVARLVPRHAAPVALKRLLGRHAPGVPAQKIVSFTRFGVSRFLKAARAVSHGQRLRHYAAQNARFGELVLRHGLGEADALYAFNAAAVEMARAARQRGLWVVLEQTSAPQAHYERLIAEERQRWRDWEPGSVEPDDWMALSQREQEEWQLADAIICGSAHVAECIRAEGGPAEKCTVVPYGIRAEEFRAARTGRPETPAPLRVLCVATVCLGKGIPYLMQAASMLPRTVAQVRLVGPVLFSDNATAQLRQVMDVAGAVPRSSIVKEYAAADVFVLPTLSEGSATVCYEALAACMPVITTPAAGAVVRDGVDGFIVPIRDPQAIAERLALLAADRAMLRQMSAAAAERAQQYTWDEYGRRLIAAVTPAPISVA
jgi:glycosyltransferase involved in cell wall biosynthesis